MKAKAFLFIICTTPLMAFQHPDSKGRIDFELEEMKRDTLLVGSFPVADLNRENVKIDTILPGQTRYTHIAETDTIAYEVVIGSADGTQGKSSGGFL